MKSTAQSKKKTQLHKANDTLKELSVNVTSEDRKAAEKSCEVSRYTIGTYLAGEAKDTDIAMKLIRFFRKRIKDRDQELSQAV